MSLLKPDPLLSRRFVGVEMVSSCICTQADLFKTVAWSPSRQIYLPASASGAGDVPVGVLVGLMSGAVAVVLLFRQKGGAQ